MAFVLENFSGRQASHSLAGTRSARQRMLCSAGRFELHVCTNKTCKKQGSLEVRTEGDALEGIFPWPDHLC
jgi:hypothetical protein